MNFGLSVLWVCFDLGVRDHFPPGRMLRQHSVHGPDSFFHGGVWISSIAYLAQKQQGVNRAVT